MGNFTMLTLFEFSREGPDPMTPPPPDLRMGAHGERMSEGLQTYPIVSMLTLKIYLYQYVLASVGNI